MWIHLELITCTQPRLLLACLTSVGLCVYKPKGFFTDCFLLCCPQTHILPHQQQLFHYRCFIFVTGAAYLAEWWCAGWAEADLSEFSYFVVWPGLCQSLSLEVKDQPSVCVVNHRTVGSPWSSYSLKQRNDGPENHFSPSLKAVEMT